MPPDGWATAEIREILESWPMRLHLTIDQVDVTIELAVDAKIETPTGEGAASDLRPGQRVRILIEHLPGFPTSLLTRDVQLLD